MKTFENNLQELREIFQNQRCSISKKFVDSLRTSKSSKDFLEVSPINLIFARRPSFNSVFANKKALNIHYLPSKYNKILFKMLLNSVELFKTPRALARYCLQPNSLGSQNLWCYLRIFRESLVCMYENFWR